MKRNQAPDVPCNMCGQQCLIKISTDDHVNVDCIEASNSWGYGTPWDMTHTTFRLCYACTVKLSEQFVVPMTVRMTDMTGAAIGPEIELPHPHPVE